jgi:hypothetical protein
LNEGNLAQKRSFQASKRSESFQTLKPLFVFEFHKTTAFSLSFAFVAIHSLAWLFLPSFFFIIEFSSAAVESQISKTLFYFFSFLQKNFAFLP